MKRIVYFLVLCSMPLIMPSLPSSAQSGKGIRFVNLHSKKEMLLRPERMPSPKTINHFLFSHRDNRYTLMDPRLIQKAALVAQHFNKQTVHIISGYRSSNSNKNMAKKGRKVAKQSYHIKGLALDFRVKGISTRRLCSYLKRNHNGGVGCYPKDGFVHIDYGPKRRW